MRLVYPDPSPFLTKELEYRAREGQALRIYFRNDRSLFADISKIIFSIISKRPPPKLVASFWRWIIPSLSRQKTRKQIKNQNRLSQYIARHTVSLNKIIYIPEKAKVLYKTKHNDYFGENIQLFTVTDFIARIYRTIKSSSSQYTFRLNINILAILRNDQRSSCLLLWPLFKQK